MQFRIAVFVLIATALVVSGSFRRRAAAGGGQIERLQEGAAALVARMAVTLPLLAVVLLFVFRPTAVAWSAIPISDATRWAGVVVGALGVLGSTWTLASLGKNVSPTVLTKDAQSLVTHGPYRWIRHPLYTFGILLLLAVGVVAANAFVLLWTGAAMFPIRLFVIPREEEELIRRFGEAYRDYQRQTGAMLPRL